MVTQLYTAPLKPYYANPSELGASLGVKRRESDDTGATTGGDEQRRDGAATLAAVKEQAQQGKISIQAVLDDFQSTMNAIGVNDQVRREVAPYLHVVAHQANKSQPGVPIIKQNLRAAAEVMDGFIADTLKQPSQVVREWVDAVLMQPLSFEQSTPATLLPENRLQMADSGGMDGALSSSSADTGAMADVMQNNPDLKALWGKARQATDEKKFDEALGHYQQMLGMLQANPQPKLHGRVLFRMGQLLSRTEQPEVAKGILQQALGVASDTRDQTLEAKIHYALAKLSGQPAEYRTTHLEQALTLSTQVGETNLEHKTRLALGQTYFQQGQLAQARNTLEPLLGALDSASPRLQATMLNRLGEVTRRQGDFKAAFGYLRQSLETAKTHGQERFAAKTLEKMAGLYLDAGKPEKALSLLQTALT